MPTRTSTMASGSQIKKTDKDSMSMLQVVCIKAVSRMTSRTGPVSLQLGKMSFKKYKAYGNRINSKVSPNMSEEAPCSKDTLRKMLRQARVFSETKEEIFMKVTGRIIK